MIAVTKSGKDKVFYAKCPKCTTEFIYALSDVKYEREGLGGKEVSTIVCPECGEKGIARLLTKEEYENEQNFNPNSLFWCAL